MTKAVGIIALFFSLFNAQVILSQTVVLKGNHPDYKNSIIEVVAIKDYITRATVIVGVDTVDASGDFYLSVDLQQTQQVYLDLGLFEGVMYLQPGDSFEIILPDYSPKTMGEILNPFFQPTQIYMGIKDMSLENLNYRIADFDEKYNQFIDEHYVDLFQKPRKHKMDSMIQVFELGYDSVDHEYFETYRTYKYAWLQYVSYKRDYRYIIRDFYNDKSVEYFNLAYMDLFNQLFTNYFSFYQNTDEGERLYSDIAYGKSPKFLAETFENNMVLVNDTLQELVMLKGINDAFYGYDFPLASLSITLDSIALLTKVDLHRQIAENIREKVYKVRTGELIPEFVLEDTSGNLVESNHLLGDYTYLNFCSVESFTCQQDFDLIKSILEKHVGAFKVVSICIDDDFEMAREFFKRNGYDWELLSYKNQKSVLDDFRVRAYPTYYLIDKEGKFKMSPAPTPTENFEYHLGKMLQAKKRGTR